MKRNMETIQGNLLVFAPRTLHFASRFSAASLELQLAFQLTTLRLVSLCSADGSLVLWDTVNSVLW